MRSALSRALASARPRVAAAPLRPPRARPAAALRVWLAPRASLASLSSPLPPRALAAASSYAAARTPWRGAVAAPRARAALSSSATGAPTARPWLLEAAENAALAADAAASDGAAALAAAEAAFAARQFLSARRLFEEALRRGVADSARAWVGLGWTLGRLGMVRDA
jgi:hypothetical protein